MKNLICFLLFSTFVFSQNYQYAIEAAPSKALGSPTDLKISQVTETTVDLTWLAPVSATLIKDYEIYNRGILLAKSIGIVTNHQLIGLTPGVSYSLTVKAVGNEGNMSADSNIQEFKTLPITTGVNNQLEEIEYFKAYLLPITQKATIQQALDKYGSVRLEKGDYSGIPVVIKNNQKLYGHPAFSQVSNITITAGSSNVVIQNLTALSITFLAGSPITNSEFKNIESTPINSTGGMIENNTFVNLSRCVLNWNMSISGYFRNNKIIKHRIQSFYPQIVMKGNSTTPSYGNTQLWINMLTPHGNGAEIDNVQDLTWVGVDAEMWNETNSSPQKPLVTMTKMGDVKIASFNGANYGTYPTPVFDIKANNFLFSKKNVSAIKGGNSTLRSGTNMFLVGSNSEDYNKEVGTTGFDFRGYFNSQNISLDGVNLTSVITDAPTITKLTNTILGNQKALWAKPSFEKLPDPTGVNWKTERVGKPDQTVYIQNLINTKGIAELDEGIYYISSTLVIKSSQGIVGKGTGKTSIVGLTDNFPLITGENETGEVKFYLANMTLQGGSTGLRIHPLNGNLISVSACLFKYLVFRNQNYGIHLDKFYGFDNNFMDHVSFVDANVGLYQEVDPTYVGGVETNTMMFMDKTVFYKCQWINNNKALGLMSVRGSNLDAWVDCNFEGNGIVGELKNYIAPVFANCTFTSTKGDYLMYAASDTEFYSCLFQNNANTATFRATDVYLEGCRFLDNVNLFKTEKANAYITNSTITGGLGSLNSGMIINSSIPSAPTFNKLLVNVKAGMPTVIINAAPKPYPQLLVTH